MLSRLPDCRWPLIRWYTKLGVMVSSGVGVQGASATPRPAKESLRLAFLSITDRYFGPDPVDPAAVAAIVSAGPGGQLVLNKRHAKSRLPGSIAWPAALGAFANSASEDPYSGLGGIGLRCDEADRAALGSPSRTALPCGPRQRLRLRSRIEDQRVDVAARVCPAPVPGSRGIVNVKAVVDAPTVERMPRMAMLVVMFVCSNTTPGVCRIMSAKSRTPRLSSVSALKALTLIGTLLKTSSLRVAVTMISVPLCSLSQRTAAPVPKPLDWRAMSSARCPLRTASKCASP